MATRRTRAVKTAQAPAQAQTPAVEGALQLTEPIQEPIQEPGLCEEVMGELEHGGKSAEDLSKALEVAVSDIIGALEELLAEGSVSTLAIFIIAKGGAR